MSVDGPPVIELADGQTQPPTATYIPGTRVGYSSDYRQSFRVTNEGVLTADAFIVHITETDPPEAFSFVSGEYSTNENGTPDNFADDTRSSSGVSVVRDGSPTYHQVKFDVALEPGESVVVHLRYRAQDTSGPVVIRPDIRIELTTATPPSGGSPTITMVDDETGDVILTFIIESWKTYQVQSSADMVTWDTWDLVITAGDFDRELTITDDGLYTDSHPSSAAQRFYRLVEVIIP